MNHPPPRDQGLTLIEILVALVIIGSVALVAAAAIPKAARAGSNATAVTDAAVSVDQLTNALQGDVRTRGTFRGFSEAGPTLLTSVFTKGGGYAPQAGTDFAQSEQFTAPGLNAQVGDLVFLTGPSNQGKLLRVTSRSGDTYAHAGCRNGISGLGARVYAANTLSLYTAGTDTYRSENQAGWTLAGQGAAVTFAYAYRDASGNVSTQATGLPLTVSGATRSGVFVTARTTTTADSRAAQDRRVMIPLPASSTTALLDCGAGIAAPTGTNRLRVTVILPAGVSSGNATASGPGLSTAFGTTNTFVGLSQGSFSVTAQPITAVNYSYSASVTGAPVTISGRNQTGYAQVLYQAVTGAMTVTVSGLPSGATGTIRVNGPSTTTRSMGAGTATFGQLAPGAYSVTGDAVTYGGKTYTTTTAGVGVNAGATSNVTVRYQAVVTGGTVNVTIYGLTYAGKYLTNNMGVTIPLREGTQTFPNVPAGTYYITAPSLGSYQPDSGYQSFGLAAGGTRSVTFTYGYEIPEPPEDPPPPPPPEDPPPICPTGGCTPPPPPPPPPPADEPPPSGGGGGGGGPPACYYDGAGDPTCGF